MKILNAESVIGEILQEAEETTLEDNDASDTAPPPPTPKTTI